MNEKIMRSRVSAAPDLFFNVFMLADAQAWWNEEDEIGKKAIESRLKIKVEKKISDTSWAIELAMGEGFDLSQEWKILTAVSVGFFLEHYEQMIAFFKEELDLTDPEYQTQELPVVEFEEADEVDSDYNPFD